MTCSGRGRDRSCGAIRVRLCYRLRMTGFDRRLLIPLLLLSACNDRADQSVLANVEADQRAAAADAGRIDCAIGTGAFAADCTIERTAGDGDTILTVRQPDGGFHRLQITRDGRGVIAADGAETAKVIVIGADRIEVAIGDARYRLPATIGPVAR